MPGQNLRTKRKATVRRNTSTRKSAESFPAPGRDLRTERRTAARQSTTSRKSVQSGRTKGQGLHKADGSLPAKTARRQAKRASGGEPYGYVHNCPCRHGQPREGTGRRKVTDGPAHTGINTGSYTHTHRAGGSAPHTHVTGLHLWGEAVSAPSPVRRSLSLNRSGQIRNPRYAGSPAGSVRRTTENAAEAPALLWSRRRSAGRSAPDSSRSPSISRIDRSGAG